MVVDEPLGPLGPLALDRFDAGVTGYLKVIDQDRYCTHQVIAPAKDPGTATICPTVRDKSHARPGII